MKAYKVELCILDTELLGEATIVDILEGVKYVYPKVKSIQCRDIGQWHDNHPLNLGDEQYYKELFSDN